MVVVVSKSTDDAVRSGEQKRRGRPSGLVRRRATDAHLWLSVGFFPEEFVGSTAPELTPPDPGLPDGDKRRRARKEADRWFRRARQEGVDLPSIPFRDERARRRAGYAANALEKAGAAARGRRTRLATVGREPDDESGR